MAINKVQYGNETLMDITDTTATANTVLQNNIFYAANGTRSVGTLGDMTGATANANGAAGLVPAPEAGENEMFLRGDGTWADGGKPMVILSYGTSTWDDFITAYNNHVIVYCRASSNSNPATGAQGRMAFMAYVNNGDAPTEVEFQYYRSVSSHSATQMGDQVYIYKLNKNSGWSVTVREGGLKQIVEGTGISVSYSSNKVTINTDIATATTSTQGLMSASDKLKLDGIVDLIYPVGSIYMSVNATSPETLFGGTWEQLEDRFLLGAGQTYTAGDTGGSASHTLTTDEMPSHNHTFTGSAVTSSDISANHTHTGTSGNPSANHTHTGPSHNHALSSEISVAGAPYGAYGTGTASSYGVHFAKPSTDSKGTGATGTVSAWHTHTTTTGNQSEGHTHSVTAEGSIGNSGSGNAFSVMNPYLAVYMWKRTA